MKIIANVFNISLLFCAFSLLTIFSQTSVSAQQLNKDQIKVAYIYNFLQHINWPNEEDKPQFIIGVYQDTKFHTLLKATFKNKTVKSKNISVLLITEIPQARKNDLFYIPQQFSQELATIANTVRGTQTLLVTDNSTDKHNAMLNMVENANAISFEVNKSNIVHEKLTTSAQLLLLGGTELDIATLYRETEQAMQRTKERESALNAELATQQARLNQTNEKLNNLNQDLQRSSDEIRQQQLAMKELVKNEQKKEQELAIVLQQLAEANKNYSIQTQAISDKKQETAVREKESSQMANLIEQNKLILQQQQQSIDTQQRALDEQSGELAAQQQTIVSQKETITITTILMVIVALALILVVGLFLKNRKTNHKLIEALSYLEEAQSQLVQSEKMASLGKLIAGVAHEINTPLGIAVTSTSLIQENTEKIATRLNDKSLTQKQLKSFINIVTESSAISNKGLERVIELMHNFKEVAADQIIEEMRKINMADYIDEVMTTLTNEMKRNNVNYFFSGDDTIEINTIPGALAQVITNLVNNSIRHGFHSDEIDNEKSNNIKINLEQISHDEVCLTYQDNGIGMSKDVLAQVFDPFFTTKRNKGGTGLGMNIVFNIIEQKLSGHISICSGIGEGVTCKITLPLLVSAD